ncbi:tumor necrosis factor receptor superfamily member 11B-like [Myxocyprinus asiaticus]|uniref:tumor necrosis factor receptor superfamily member 11B-like n=1 Tax=Myxocyprinus asiaticus TaxID=70543 RepID=UPI0022229F9D|nr:tumor necrosis factor receptor superfamily member 11B-like [Myxocyprinus asiaticus]
MRVLNMRPPTAVKLQMLFAMSFAWAYHEIPKYQHRDPVTFKVMLCDQCPPGTAVERHCSLEEPTVCAPCPEKCFAEQWHWGDSCQHCTSVCKERQIIRRECNSTHDRICECIPGYHLVVEFCVRHTACPPGSGVVVQGTPERDSVCEKCPQGYFSSRSSSTEPCLPLRDCTLLGLKTFRPGTATQDTLCEIESKDFTFDCSHQHTECQTDITLCEEAIFQFLASPPLASVPMERLSESLPGRKVDWKSVERLKKSCSPQQQMIHLLHLWREQNKDQDKLLSIIPDIMLWEEAIFQFFASPPLASVTVERLSESLPGRKVDWKCVERLKKSCSPQQQTIHLLHLWREQNKDQDKLLSIIPGVNHCERKLSHCASVKNLTLGELLVLMESLPGEKVSEEDIRAVVHSCPSQNYIMQLLHLWKIQNGGHDLSKALAHSIRKLRSKGARRPLLKTLKRISRIISVSSIHKMYEKMIVNILQDSMCFKTKPYND